MKNLNRRQFMNLAAGAAASTISLAARSAALAKTAKAPKRSNPSANVAANWPKKQKTPEKKPPAKLLSVKLSIGPPFSV